MNIRRIAKFLVYYFVETENVTIFAVHIKKTINEEIVCIAADHILPADRLPSIGESDSPSFVGDGQR